MERSSKVKYLMVKFLTNFLIILLYSFKVIAQNNSGDSILESAEDIYSSTIINETDTTRYRTTYISTIDSINIYKADKKFDYVYYLDSILRQKKIPVETVSSENLKESDKKKRSSEQAAHKAGNFFNNTFIRVILWILAFCFIAFVLYKLFLTGGIFSGNSFNKNNDHVQMQDENSIENSQYDRLINEAVSKKDFRLATRYLYLQTLQKLFAAGLLQFSPDKTNYQYVTELRPVSGSEEFTLLTKNYEYAWYGKFNISEEAYPQIQKRFKQYHQKI